MRTAQITLMAALLASPQIAAADSAFARCYKVASNYAQRIEYHRTRAAARACDGMLIDLAAGRANAAINSLIRGANRRFASFAGSGPAACDPQVFDGDPLPAYPVPAETLEQTVASVLERMENCDGVTPE